MDISHVIRGEEWISSAPKHVWLFEAFGWEPPVFVHVPVIKGKDGAKLSKRHGDTRCLDFRAAGYLPEAMANFIALIGWAPGGDRELMSMSEMEEAFDLMGLQPSPGIFDPDKLKWMNGHYIRELPAHELAVRLRDYLAHPDTEEYWSRPEHSDPQFSEGLALLKGALTSGVSNLSDRSDLSDISESEWTQSSYVVEALALEQPRVHTLPEFGPACEFFFQEEPPLEPTAVEKWFGEPHVPDLFGKVVLWLEDKAEVGVEECEAVLRGYAEENGFEKLGPIVHPVRVALTGKTVGPGLFELMSLLGPERMKRRLVRARKLVS